MIIGLGNPLCGDDGIGPAVLEALAGRTDATCVDAGASGMQVVHALAGRRCGIVVDCARMGLPPGAIRRFTLAEIAGQRVLPRLSVHEGDLLTFLTLARQLDDPPPGIVLFGIEPETLDPGTPLSPTLSAKLEEYVVAVLAEVEKMS